MPQRIDGSRLAARMLALASVVVLGGCARPPHAPAARLGPGVYRAVILLPGGELPFGFSVVERDGRKRVEAHNGREVVEVTELDDRAGRFVLRFPGYENRIEASAAPGGYSGAVVMVRRGGREVRLPFGAERGERFRFARTPTPDPPNVAGRWAIVFTDADGKTSPAVAEFEQQGARVTGTFLDPTGDHRFLEGELVDDELELSRFDGGSAFLYRARVLPDGTLKGKFWSGNWSVQALTGHRDDSATLNDPAVAAAAAAAEAPFAFSFPDLDGRSVALADARFNGKVVIVSLGGSWCPNCHDEAAFLKPLYGALHARGLEIIYLEFEYFGDFAQAVAANRRFVAKYGIDWPVLIAGISDKDEAARKLPRLGHVYAFPTTIVIDRSGRLRDVHSGFSGPATGQHYEEFRRSFTGLIESLLDEPG
jgi:peroxiredoxin